LYCVRKTNKIPIGFYIDGFNDGCCASGHRHRPDGAYGPVRLCVAIGDHAVVTFCKNINITLGV
jgi:hypothetical protein